MQEPKKPLVDKTELTNQFYHPVAPQAHAGEESKDSIQMDENFSVAISKVEKPNFSKVPATNQKARPSTQSNINTRKLVKQNFNTDTVDTPIQK